MLVLAVSLYEELKDGIEKLWIDFGAGKNRKFVSIHEIFQRIGELKARDLPFFHGFTGCNQVQFLSHVTKHTAWKVWCLFTAISNVFSDFCQQPRLMQVQEVMTNIERFTVLLHYRTSNCFNTDECRTELFCPVSTITHQQVRLCGNTFFDHVTSQEMCRPSP